VVTDSYYLLRTTKEAPSLVRFKSLAGECLAFSGRLSSKVCRISARPMTCGSGPPICIDASSVVY
jgi:Fe-S-cluster containining protein